MRPWPQRHRRTTHVIVHRYDPTGTDRHGNPLPSWPSTERVDGCVIAPTATTEPTEAGRDAVVTTPTLYAPPGTRIGAQDRVEGPDGTLYTVEGTPATWPPNPITCSDPPGVVVTLKHVQG